MKTYITIDKHGLIAQAAVEGLRDLLKMYEKLRAECVAHPERYPGGVGASHWVDKAQEVQEALELLGAPVR